MGIEHPHSHPGILGNGVNDTGIKLRLAEDAVHSQLGNGLSDPGYARRAWIRGIPRRDCSGRVEPETMLKVLVCIVKDDEGLEMLSGSNRALGAYELLGYLEEAGYGSKPPTIYRALQFLIQHGFAHKIERLNAFVACTHPGEPHSPAFPICRSCNRVIEAYAPPAKSVLGKQVRAAGFRIEGTVVEAVGLCPRCIEEERKCA